MISVKSLKISLLIIIVFIVSPDKVDTETINVLGKMKISRVLLHGAPRVGKTCVTRLVLNQPAVKQESTGLVNDPVRAISTSKIVSVNQTSLEKLDKNKILKLIRSEIRKAPKKKKTKEEVQVSDKPAHQMTTTTTTNDPRSNRTTSELKILSEIAEIRQEVDSVAPDSSSIFDCHHVHLVDSGGQQQFSDLLPLILQSQSHHHMVVIRLDKLLHDKAENCLEIDGKKYILSESLSLTNYQLIERVCQQASGSDSRVFVIGTHLDCENKDEPLSMKNELLKPLLEKYKYNLSHNENDETIIAVNAMTENEDERKKFAAKLHEAILSAPILVDEGDTNNTGDGIPVPLKWIILENELSDQSKQAKVLHMDEIREVADALGITDETDLSKALACFKKLAMLYHYPEVKVLSKIVFTSVSPISSLLSKIVEASIKRSKNPAPVDADKERLQKTGELTLKLYNRLSNELQAEEAIEHFPKETFIPLMLHLRVLFDIGENTYLVPSLFPVETTAISNSYFQEPLLCFWLKNKDCFLPQSFFVALIVELLRRDEVELNRKCKQSRSALVFDVELPAENECRVCVVNKDFWLEIFVDKFTKSEADCQLIIDIIQACTKRVLEQLKLSLGDLQYGIWCGSEDCKMVSPSVSHHPSKCHKKKERGFHCLKTRNLWELTTEDKLFWFNG